MFRENIQIGFTVRQARIGLCEAAIADNDTMQVRDCIRWDHDMILTFNGLTSNLIVATRDY